MGPVRRFTFRRRHAASSLPIRAEFVGLGDDLNAQRAATVGSNAGGNRSTRPMAESPGAGSELSRFLLQLVWLSGFVFTSSDECSLVLWRELIQFGIFKATNPLRIYFIVIKQTIILALYQQMKRAG